MVVRNEEAGIASEARQLITLDYPADKLDVVVVSRRFRTTELARSLPRMPTRDSPKGSNSAKPSSQGKAAGLNDAIKLATGDILLFTDARQQIEPGALEFADRKLCRPRRWRSQRRTDAR